MGDTANAKLSDAEQKLLKDFLDDNRLFFAPDPEILAHHGLEPRSAREEQAIARCNDPHRLNQVRGRLTSAMEEGYRMVEQMGSAPGAKWGDLVTAVYTASGDLSDASAGIIAFASVSPYPIKFINKYWRTEPTVGVREGDAFLMNDSRYGNIHNTDQSLIMPFFHGDELVCWLSSTIHEGENGACEPGGMPASAVSSFDEGIRMPPFRIVENFEVRRDLLTFLQNSVRDPKLQYEDVKVKLFAILRMRERLFSIIEEFGLDALVAFLRRNLEDTEAEVRRRISEMPDGIVRYPSWIDSTLREPALLKVNCELHKKGDRATWVIRGTSPQLNNRAINCLASSIKAFILTGLVQQIWPDLPRNQAVFSAFGFEADPRTLVACDNDAPMPMSILPAFRYLIKPGQIMNKFMYSVPLEAKSRITMVMAAQYNQPATFIYGGVTQHLEITGNFCADINGAGQGGRSNRDGEHSVSPCFSFMADTGEQELIEEELPVVRLVAQQLAKDRVGWGKFRGGLGYEQMLSSKGTPMWGFMTGQTGSEFNSCPGLFGGYSSPAYPLCRVKGINVFEWIKDPQNAKRFPHDIVGLMNQRPIEGGKYIASPGITFEPTTEGEIYMMCQGGGGGYGDVLQRDPESVMKDLQQDLISDESAWDIFRVVYDRTTRRVDAEATRAARDDERKARIARGRPFKEFCKEWVKPEPPIDLPYYGSWGDNGTLYTGHGPTRQKMDAANAQPVWIQDPREARIAELEAQLAEMQARLGNA
jgi:N-methylhydantoinase B/oxoprolinase/acetone carboxylase alpha subunit